MGRSIVTKAEVAARQARVVQDSREAVAGVPVAGAAGPGGGVQDRADGYLDRLVKYVPADVIAFYLAVQAGIVNLPDGQRLPAGWLVFLFFFFGTAAWLRKAGVTHRAQLVLSCAAFAVWVLATGGGPLALTEWGKAAASAWGPIVVPIFTFAAALVEPKDAPAQAA